MHSAGRRAQRSACTLTGGAGQAEVAGLPSGALSALRSAGPRLRGAGIAGRQLTGRVRVCRRQPHCVACQQATA